MEPSRASIPRGHSFVFRLLEAEEFSDYTIHWLFNGRRLPGAHKAELSFFHMRPQFDGEYKVVLVRGSEILASNGVRLTTLAGNAEAKITNEPEDQASTEFFVFDPSSESEEDATVVEIQPSNKKKAFLAKALNKTKKAA